MHQPESDSHPWDGTGDPWHGHPAYSYLDRPDPEQVCTCVNHPANPGRRCTMFKEDPQTHDLCTCCLFMCEP